MAPRSTLNISTLKLLFAAEAGSSRLPPSPSVKEVRPGNPTNASSRINLPRSSPSNCSREPRSTRLPFIPNLLFSKFLSQSFAVRQRLFPSCLSLSTPRIFSLQNPKLGPRGTTRGMKLEHISPRDNVVDASEMQPPGGFT